MTFAHFVDNLAFMIGVFVFLCVLDILLQGVRKVEYVKGDRVKTRTLGYKDVEWIVISEGPRDRKDGHQRFYLRKPGSSAEILFRTDEFDLFKKREEAVKDMGGAA